MSEKEPQSAEATEAGLNFCCGHAERQSNEIAKLRNDLQRNATGRPVCPDCYRFKARNADECAAGDCSKWYAIRDADADRDCQHFRDKTGYWSELKQISWLKRLRVISEEVKRLCDRAYDGHPLDKMDLNDLNFRLEELVKASTRGS